MMQLATNAPAHWPAVIVNEWNSVRTWNNAEPVAIALDQGFIAAGIPRPIVLYGSRLYDEGVLEVPIQFVDKGQSYCIFLYGDSPESAGQFAAARRLVEVDGKGRAVYYAPASLPDAAPLNPFGPFWMRYIGSYGRSAPPGNYAMWWATPGDENLMASPTFELIRDFYDACDGIETLILGDVLNSLGQPGGRMALPDDSVTLAIYGPEKHLMVFGASSKGLRFFFPIDSTAPAYRDRFWKHVTAYARRFKTNVQATPTSLDPDTHRRGIPWWNMINQMLKQQAGKTERFGPLVVLPDKQ